jgi:spore coat polysaccharide biosynthesis predicted glycosyltransferase SpsG
VISQVEHQEKYSQQIQKLGGCVHLGFHKDISDEDILNGFESLLNDFKRRRDVARLGRKLVDGRGLNRIADIVIRTISIRKDLV